MRPKGFVVAMLARITPAPADDPFLGAGPDGPHWLILCRWGEDGRHLTLSHVRTADDPAAPAAPAALHPQRTLYGALAKEDMQEGSVFLLARTLPADLRVAGAFVPAEGYVRLEAVSDGRLRTVAVLRAGAAASWPDPALCIRAAQRPWQGEAFDEAAR